MPKPVRLTREELYQKVWAESLATLGPKLGLSDVGLAKMCRRMHIPMPGRSYRAKKAAGQSVRRAPLPVLPPTRASDALRVATVYPPDTDAAGEPIDPASAQKRFERDPVNTIVVPERLTSPHPLVASSMKALSRAKAKEDGAFLPVVRRCVCVRVTQATLGRSMRIMDALIKACETRGWPVSIGSAPQHHTIVRVLDEDLSVELDEQIRLMEGSKHSPGGWPPAKYVPSGTLALRINEAFLSPKGWPRIRLEWGDAVQQRVETSLNALMVGLVVAAIRVKSVRLQQEEREQEIKAERQQRREEYLRAERPAARVRALNHSIAQQHRARMIRDYVATVRAVPNALEHNPDLVQWLNWAEQYADSIDPLLPRPEVPEDPDPPKLPPWLAM